MGGGGREGDEANEQLAKKASSGSEEKGGGEKLALFQGHARAASARDPHQGLMWATAHGAAGRAGRVGRVWRGNWRPLPPALVQALPRRVRTRMCTAGPRTGPCGEALRRRAAPQLAAWPVPGCL